MGGGTEGFFNDVMYKYINTVVQYSIYSMVYRVIFLKVVYVIFRPIKKDLRSTLSRVYNYPYIYILYSTLRDELWKLESFDPSSSAYRRLILYGYSTG